MAAAMPAVRSLPVWRVAADDTHAWSLLVTYRSPYSTRGARRSRRSPVWPVLFSVLLFLVLVVAGILALGLAGFRISRMPGDIGTAIAGGATPGGTPTGSPSVRAGEPGSMWSPVAGTPRVVQAGGSPVVDTRDARSVAQAYVDRWNAKDYNGMYDLISAADQANITRDKFTARYQAIAEEAGLTEVKAALGPATPGVAQFPMRVAMQSSLVGSITEDNTITLRQDGQQWRVAWTPSLIFKDLGDGLIRFIPDIPQRGRILDRKGRPLAQQGLVTQIGVIPEQIKNEAQFLPALSKAIGIPPDQIKAKYASAQPSWFVPLKIMPEQLPADIDAQLKALQGQGVAVRKVPERVYPQGTLAAHIVGYISDITAEELKTLAPKGYTAGDRIGRAGIEAWGEQYLAGKKGGQLTVIGPNGAVRTVIAQRKSEPAADIQLTIDIDLQRALEEGLGDRPSSGVVMDPATGGILAMASHPTYDPNGFILGFSDADWAKVNDSNLRPLLDRATQAAYPSGSIFKVVTATAAVERLGYTPDTQIDCPGTFTVPGISHVWHDWIPGGQGVLTLKNAIVRSCNTVFYQLGQKLNEKDPNILPEFARGFGLGKPTGLEELPEIAGTVPDPQWKQQVIKEPWSVGDAVNFAIGQGYFLATPLQMANLYTAVTNGGTLLRPFLAAKVTAPDGTVLRATDRKEIGKLPASPGTIALLHQAMTDVVNAPNGTAVQPFQGSPIQVAGKTGTAEVPPAQPHAWFASFAPANDPKIMVLTMVENGGPGSQVAAPVARHVYDIYATLNPKP